MRHLLFTIILGLLIGLVLLVAGCAHPDTSTMDPGAAVACSAGASAAAKASVRAVENQPVVNPAPAGPGLSSPQAPPPASLPDLRVDELTRQLVEMRQRLDKLSLPAPSSSVDQARPAPTTPAVTLPAVVPVVRLVSAEKDALYRRYLPEVASESFASLLRSGIVFYDDEVMPRCYQVFDGASASGVFLTSGRLTANNEFPWADPAGTQPRGAVSSVRFFHLGGPVQWWRQQNQDGTFGGFAWEFMAGTMFGEILVQKDSQGNGHTWLVRTRTKTAGGNWDVDELRPFPTEASFAEALAARGIRFAPDVSRRQRVDSMHQRNAFRSEAFETVLPDIPERVVGDLLDRTPFRSAKGQFWREHGGAVVAAPTSESSFGIVPRGYLGAFLPVSNTACMRCHEDAGQTVNRAGEDRWRLRGNDAIWSFQIWEPSSIGRTMPELNRQLVQAGLLKHMEGRP